MKELISKIKDNTGVTEYHGVKIFENDYYKFARRPEYNFNFSKETGKFARWGKTLDHDPEFASSPEILDIQISTICHGIKGKLCKFCYQGNTQVGKNMSLDTFKAIHKKFPKLLCQCALSTGDIDANPDIWNIMEYCRNNDYNKIIPNLTINGDRLTDGYVNKLVELTGAIAVSVYTPKDVAYDAVKRLVDAGHKQVNLHFFLADETYERAFEVLHDMEVDERLKGVKAIVFLSLKQRSRGKNFKPLSQFLFSKLVDHALKFKIPIGFDSCSSWKFMEALKDYPNYSDYAKMVESCESFGLFSAYVDVNGVYFPCSFADGCDDWTIGIDMVKCDDFGKDLWFSEKLNKWRRLSIDSGKNCHNCRKCLLYEV